MQISLKLTMQKKAAIYRALASQSGSIIDCGAAIGSESVEMYEAGNKGPFVMVEPFPGNIDIIANRRFEFYFSLTKKAINADGASANFFIPQVVSDAATGRWKGLAGYSSTGHLPITMLDKIKALYRRFLRGGYYVSVDGTTIDEICSDVSQIRCIKTDLQGAEYEALKGAAETIATQKTDVFILEFTGNPKIFDFFDSNLYDFFAVDLTRMGRKPVERIGDFVRTGNDLSSTMKLIEYFAAKNPDATMDHTQFSTLFGRFKTFNYCDVVVCHKRATTDLLNNLKA